ncbi:MULTISPECIES: EAL domain-containing protein [Dickeya]|uniref:EAL domain-containing protein n=1 Tax=Dickeya TaxID=204037 RepID=UPI0003A54845|nr:MULTISPECIES: EAL domain-containing protein [Dickeya]UGA49565.1 EAL domain-containing protein [Dickeya fangzhongdai]UMB75243.1 EAL domain-containing protein [Dickeya fangzhongdai]UWH05916.1 EAL domain-containing protein [Dickeya fangzhongdai]
MNKLIAFLTFLAMFAVGLCAIYYQDYRAERKSAYANAERAVRNIEEILNEAKDAVEDSKPLLAQSCTPDVIRQLNMTAAIASHLRTVSLIKNDVVYCSSLYGVDNRPASLGRFHMRELALLAGNSVTPERTLIMYLGTTADGSIGVAIHGQHLTNVLDLLSKRRDLYLLVGNTWISRDNKVSAFNPDDSRNFVIIPSSRYHFSILFPHDDKYSLADFWDQEKMTLLVVFLIALGSGFLAYKYSTRFNSPYDGIRRAIENQEVLPYYQPVIATESQEIYGVEVLARWHHPKSGFISPDIFIPLCEQSGLIIPMTRSLMSSVVRDLTSHLDTLPDHLHIGINISAQHCQSDDFITDCQNFIAAFGEKKVHLIIEITEREKIEITPETIAFFKKLSDAGVLIALDDFGTGYSNFDYLRKLHVNVIKIDQSFVSMIDEDDPQSSTLVNCVIDLAQQMNLMTVAEGVETEYQAAFLSRKQINFMQGYFFSRPLPFDELAQTWLSKR